MKLDRMSRRDALQKTILGGAALVAAGTLVPQMFAAPSAAPAPAAGPFQLPPLTYALDALEPHIDARTMEIHHGKHHAAYVTNLNKALADHPELQKKSIEDLIRNLNTVPEAARTAVRNNGGGHLNHTWFWQMMGKGKGGDPKGEVAKALEKSFGKFSKFQESFTSTAIKTFGSGWAWLSLNPAKELIIESTGNQDNPITHGNTPLLGIDVWEHAYYLKYQNKRVDYVNAFYNVIDWDFVTERYRTASSRN
jgi:superoxide dismutase, Fe-Mn family